MEVAASTDTKSLIKPALAEIGYLLRKHPGVARTMERRRSQRGRSKPLNFCLERRSVEITVWGSSGVPTKVIVQFPIEIPEEPVRLSTTCHCPNMGLPYCEHTWAALQLLRLALVDDDPQMPLQMADLLAVKDWRYLLNTIDEVVREGREVLGRRPTGNRLAWKLGWNAHQSTLSFRPVEQ